ncbi:MAG: biosynthetic arginine decarboxylase [Candidatus Heimdallarchaeota archaeon]|nr:biosynthetic arginine decarboxylase [Candidatus Heimdallarchaeota archaeon]
MKSTEWTINDSQNVYGIGKTFREFNFLEINSQGELCLRIKDEIISFKEILSRLHKQITWTDIDQCPSLTLRIPQLVEYQIAKLNQSFSKALNEYNYKGEFTAVYPIKVNQQKHAINSVLKSKFIKYGLEVGTKAEFLITLRALKDHTDRYLVCNGVKDLEYLGLAIKKLQEGWNVLISVETFRELKTLLNLTTDPSILKLSLRLKPYFSVSGHWAHSSGRDSKFGLSIGELTEVLTYLEETNNKNIVVALHAHIGSQITSLEDFKFLAQYLTILYKEFRNKGLHNLHILDFGGGLSIDYEGRITDKNPDTFDTYAKHIVEGIVTTIDDFDHPDIMIETGRAITALSSIVLAQILEIKDIFPEGKIKDEEKAFVEEWKKRIQKITTVDEFRTTWFELLGYDAKKNSSLRTTSELFHHEILVSKIRRLFRKELGKEFYLKTLQQFISDPSLNLLFTQAEKYALCNFSVFNSACDHILVKQYFPIFPIEFLDKQPETIVRIVDITCDSDGEISQFITKRTDTHPKFTLDHYPLQIPVPVTLKGIPVPNCDGLNESYFAIGLLGAYQDIIEFDHNLLGDLPDALIQLDGDDWKIEWSSDPESPQKLITKMGYKGDEIFPNMGKMSYAKDSWNRKENNTD